MFLDLVAESRGRDRGDRAGARSQRRGLGYERLREVNPALVFCALSGFGQTGPFRDLATHGVAYDAYGGPAAPERTDEGFPRDPDANYKDIGTQAGRRSTRRSACSPRVRARATGEGAFIDVAQADAAVAWSAAGLDP